ncbi:MAG: translation initiation factor Sui1 [Thermodesulfobacteriota bacterium]
MKKKTAHQGLVYSTEYGRMCPACGQPEPECRCRNAFTPPPGDRTVRISRQTKGRKGAGVTLISGLALDEAALWKLAGELKRTCGCGGTVKAGVIEIQGDQRQTLIAELRNRGFVVKSAGG